MSQQLSTFGYTQIGSTSLTGYVSNPLNDDLNVANYDVNNVQNLNVAYVAATNGVAVLQPPTFNGSDVVAFSYQTPTGKLRWSEGTGNTESGSNMGSDYKLFAYNDLGTYLNNPITVVRKTGKVQLENDLSVGGNLNVAGNTIMNGSITGNVNINITGTIISTGSVVTALNVSPNDVTSGPIVNLTSADLNKVMVFQAASGGLTVNLPATTGLPNGSWIRVANYGAATGVINVVGGMSNDPVASDCSMTYCVVQSQQGANLANWCRLTG